MNDAEMLLAFERCTLPAKAWTHEAHVRVAWTYLERHDEATALFAKHNPKMVLADIQLADGSSGIDAVNEILSSTPVPVIFITAFPERLLTGERPEPAFLVTKPFNPDMVKALISQALFFDRQAKAAA